MDNTGWKYDPPTILEKLCSRFPDARWNELESQIGLYWGVQIIDRNEPSVNIHLARDGMGIKLIGRTAPILPIVAWLASELPQSPQLIVCDEGFNEYAELSSSTTVMDLNEVYKGYW